MCGIAAIFNYRTTDPVNGAELECLRDHMVKRGPDAFGSWFSSDRRVGLAHRRLSIQDLSPAGAQPMMNNDASCVIVFNGEIYNFPELRAGLEKKGYQFRSHSDTEVLLYLYHCKGEEMVHDLRGMFAFAIWDHARRGLFLARDHFGIKPLYYANDGRTFRIASQVKALQSGKGFSTSPDPAAQVGFLLWGHIPEPFTTCKEIRSLPAGASLWIDDQGPRPVRQWCKIEDILRSPAAARNGDARAIAHEALRNSVRHHLIADVPVGVFLSSGIDSTALTGLVAEQGGECRTLTLGFEEYRGTEYDEVPLAEKVAAHYGAKHQTLWIRSNDFSDNFDRVLQAMDQPTIDGLNTFFVSRAAAQAGLKVALSGLGGDEMFGGYPSFRELPKAVRRLGFTRWLPGFGSAFRVVSAPVVKRLTSPKYAGLFEYGGSYGGAYLLRRGLFMPWELPQLLDPEIVRAGWSELQTLLRLAETESNFPSDHARIAALELTWYMRNQLLRDTDWASMDHSVEIRVPLVDIDLLRALAPLVANGHALSKQDLAHAPAKPLPPEILSRPKTGFTVPVRDWLAQNDSAPRERGLRGWAKMIASRFGVS